ncbi:ferredoxin reductase [Noviherbaspirillum autotrophicum]|uniref:ferredoxin reductase n=1 Tax=Noviherbaspirillum autotrophicum TaxID=709839 RepID=UPI00069448D8|nr:ferredoxin reductase [Noviherbaspirillum autotrophicum]
MPVLPNTAPAARTWPHAAASALKTSLQHPWIASVVGLAAVEDALRALHPMLSLSSVRARVVRVIDETPDTRTFVMRPNALWLGARAGQFVRVQVEIDGRRRERAYSLSSPPGARRLAITVKRQDGGLVSPYLHDAVKHGTVLTLSQAAGEFVLPARLPPKILLLSAGSGITPMMALLGELRSRMYRGDVVFYHVCRNARQFIFSQQLQALAKTWPALRLVTHFSEQSGRWQAASLRAHMRELSKHATWMCGPTGMMDAVQALWTSEHFLAPLHSERFSAAPLRLASGPDVASTVRLRASGKQFVARGSAPLLLQAERAGLSPKYGCRIGICHSCQCTKASGSVENLQTGEVSGAPDEQIRLCISAARSDLVLDL